MKYILSIFILLVSSLFSTPILAAERGELYLRSVEIADLMYLKEAEATPMQKQKVKELFKQIEIAMQGSNVLACKTGNEVFSQIFSWARSPQGPGLNIAQAQELAEAMSAQFCPDRYFAVASEAFAWARSPQGLSANIGQGLSFAELVSDFESRNLYDSNALACIQQQFNFARSPGGMSSNIEEAKKFALKRCITH